MVVGAARGFRRDHGAGRSLSSLESNKCVIEHMTYDHLLSHTESLMNQMFWFQQTISKPKAASHRGVAVKYVDIKELKQGFIRELKCTAMNWVYSKKKYAQLLQDELPKRGGDVMNVQGYLYEVADQKFRKGCPQGQFGELLLFNFIQHFFKAPPLLRKMPITTNPGVERHGADAIHYREIQDAKIFILGESKCYLSKYQFNTALKASIDSIFTSFNNIENELILYQYDDFIDPELKGVAADLKDGKLDGARFELVCLVAYEETKSIEAPTEDEIKAKIKACINERWSGVADDVYDGIKQNLVERINYVVFPIWGLEALLNEF